MDEIFTYFNEMLLLCGILFAIMGGIMYFFPPKKINGLYGYRTGSSMKNQKNWDFSQKYSAKVMFIFGLIMVFISPSKGIFNLSEKVSLGLGLFVLIIGSVVMILITEKAIKKMNQS